tara:strand:- start:88 stop:297 length:210 start_codon:yes stop_codon:yes gene_type:complete
MKMRLSQKSYFEQWFEMYWLKNYDESKANTKYIDDYVKRFIHVLLITGEEEVQGHVSSIHQKKLLLANE